MRDKDLIIRVSGTNESTEKFLTQISKEAAQLGLLPANQSVRAVPDKVRKEDVKNKKAKDLKISVNGDEGTVETFITNIIDIISKETSLPNPSINLKLGSNESDD